MVLSTSGARRDAYDGSCIDVVLFKAGFLVLYRSVLHGFDRGTVAVWSAFAAHANLRGASSSLRLKKRRLSPPITTTSPLQPLPKST
jgi:hypothetical protein